MNRDKNHLRTKKYPLELKQNTLDYTEFFKLLASDYLVIHILIAYSIKTKKFGGNISITSNKKNINFRSSGCAKINNRTS
jgi:hypothetical protein